MNAARYALIALPLLLACSDKADEDDGDDADGASASDAYFSALCRLYTAPACISAMDEDCSYTIEFETEADCASFLDLAVGSCDGAEAWMTDNSAQVKACADQIDAIECGADPICEPSGEDVTTTGDCAEVDAQLGALCGDTGS